MHRLNELHLYVITVQIKCNSRLNFDNPIPVGWGRGKRVNDSQRVVRQTLDRQTLDTTNNGQANNGHTNTGHNKWPT